MFFHKRTNIDPEAQIDEWIVEKILRHRVIQGGELQFLTKWVGFDEKSATWEPVKSFIHRYNSDFAKYCQEKNLRIDISKYLSQPPD